MSTTRHTNPYEPIQNYPDEYLERVIEYPGPNGKEEQSEGGRSPQNQILEEPEKSSKVRETLIAARQNKKLKNTLRSPFHRVLKERNIL